MARCPTCYRRLDETHRTLGRCPDRFMADWPKRHRYGYVAPSRADRVPRDEYLAGVQAPCGTRQAYKRHVANGEKADPACLAANAAYVRDRAKASRGA